MANAVKKYTLEELHIGMEVKPEELSEIYDTWILLVKKTKEEIGKIAFIGKKTDKNSDELFKQGYVTPIYNDSSELNGDIYYEE